MQWCKNERAYDLMDVVNHHLREIEYYGYRGPKINYMFIDEVQDLTASTTLLISKMAINNILYCGDTAQAITKGVSFRFEDLKLLYNKEYCKNALNL
jgi:superfamily I DNA/RNA helicase